MNKLKIFWKVMLVSYTMALFVIAAGWFGIHYIDKLKNDTNGDYLVALKTVNALSIQSQTMKSLLLESFLTDKSPQVIEREQSQYIQGIGEFNRLLAMYEKTQTHAYSMERVSFIKRDMAIYWQASERALQLAVNGQSKEGYRQYVINGEQAIHNVNVLLHELTDHHSKMIEKARQARLAEVEQLKVTLMTMTAMLTGIVLMLGILLARMISRPVKVLQESIKKSARGNVHRESDDEFSNISRFCSEMIQDRVALINLVSQSTTNLRLSTNELAATCEDICSAIADTEQQILLNRQQITEMGNCVSESLGKIRLTMDVLDEKKNENSLYVLNAAIKATRTGQHDRELIAMASEVRCLAEESKKSAEEITTLLHKAEHDISALLALVAQCQDIGDKGTGTADQVNQTLFRIKNEISQNLIFLSSGIQKLTID